MPADIPAIQRILKDTELFPEDMLEELIAPFFDGNNGGERWFVAETDAVEGFAYVRPEPLADGTWNLLAIGVRTGTQGKGLGSSLMRCVEDELSDQRILIVETSGLPEFEKTRRFYLERGYAHEATLRDYWADGDDKVVFWKALGG